MAVLCDLMQQRYRTAATAIGSSGIQRILIEDASGQVMPKSNADAFPAHGNHHGKTAGVKIDLAFDLLTGSIVSHSLQAATEQDRTIGKEFVVEVRRGDLVLRDMGCFSLSEFTAIELLEAWWLTRLPLTNGVMLADGRSLEKYLKSFQGDIIDINAIVGEQGKKCRLVAMRAAPEVSAARRAERRKKARDCGKNPCPKGLIFSNAPTNGGTYTLGGQQFQISYFGNYEAAIPTFSGGNDVVLMAVPEPGAALIGGMGVLLLLRRRRDV